MQPGYYAMNPDGRIVNISARLTYYDDLFRALRETERFSPDKSYSVSTGESGRHAQVILHLPIDPSVGSIAVSGR